jgi:hypothetical protein
MRFVRGYGGFLTVGGRDMVFAIMTNDTRRRKLADAGTTGLRSTAWMNKARRLEQSILTDWVADHWSGDAPQYAEAAIITPDPMPIGVVTTQSSSTSSVTMAPVRTVQSAMPVTLAATNPITVIHFQDRQSTGKNYVRTTSLVE